MNAVALIDGERPKRKLVGRLFDLVFYSLCVWAVADHFFGQYYTEWKGERYCRARGWDHYCSSAYGCEARNTHACWMYLGEDAPEGLKYIVVDFSQLKDYEYEVYMLRQRRQ